MKKFIRFLLILFLLIALVVIYARYGGTEGLKTKEYTIETKDIATTFDGIKIVHFSDLHYLRVTNKNKLKQIVKEINLINPDIVFFTGDLIDKDFTTTDKDKDDLIEELNNIKSKYGKYAIIGNHDHVKDIDLLKDIYTNSGFTLLQNSYDIIYGKDNDKLFIGGVDTYSMLHVAAFPFFIFLYIPDKVDFTPVTIPDILADDMRRSLILELVGPKLKSSNKLYAMFVIPEPFDFDKTPFPPAKPLAKPKVVSIPNSNQSNEPPD